MMLLAFHRTMQFTGRRQQIVIVISLGERRTPRRCYDDAHLQTAAGSRTLCWCRRWRWWEIALRRRWIVKCRRCAVAGPCHKSSRSSSSKSAPSRWRTGSTCRESATTASRPGPATNCHRHRPDYDRYRHCRHLCTCPCTQVRKGKGKGTYTWYSASS